MKTVNEILESMEKDGTASEARSKLYCTELQELAESGDLYDVLLNAYMVGYYKSKK